MAWIAVGTTAVSVGNSLYQGSQNRNAAKKAGKAMDPFGRFRVGYGNDLKKTMDNPGDFLNSPLFKSAFNMGQQGVMRGMAGEGMIGSGNMATGLQQYGQSQSFNMWEQYAQFLAHLAGADIGANYGPALGGMIAGTDQMTRGFGQLGELAGTFFGGGGGGGVAPITPQAADAAFNTIPDFNPTIGP